MPDRKLKINNMERVLSAGYQCILKSGDGFQLKAVAETAGVSLRSVLRYFPSKESLIAKVIENRLQRFAENCQSAQPARQDGSGADRVKALLDAFLEVFVNDADQFIFLCYVEFYMYSRDCGRPADSYTEMQGLLRSLFKDAILCGQRDGSLKNNDDADLLCDIVLNSVSGMLQKLALLKNIDSQHADGYLNVIRGYTDSVMHFLTR